MKKMISITVVSGLLAYAMVALFFQGAVVAAKQGAVEHYQIDPAHTAVIFRIKHFGLSYTYGRFNEVAGQFTIDRQNPAATQISMTIKTASLDTNEKRRDKNLRGPDYFNVKQFPVIRFKSTAVKAHAKGLSVTGDFTLHGKTKSITFVLEKIGEGNGPYGKYRYGFDTTLKIKRSDFGMGYMVPKVGDEVEMMIGFEGIRQ